MKRLELKHIAPYLPYGLKVRHELEEKFNTLIVMGIHDDGGRVRYENEKDVSPKFSLAVCWKERHKYESTKYFFIQDNFKPILRPLSDLAKEIEHNGKAFHPIKELAKMPLTNEGNALMSFYSLNTIGVGKYLEDVADYNAVNTKYLSYPLAQKLLEWHFDIHHLIDKDLAIDINNL